MNNKTKTFSPNNYDPINMNNNQENIKSNNT